MIRLLLLCAGLILVLGYIAPRNAPSAAESADSSGSKRPPRITVDGVEEFVEWQELRDLGLDHDGIIISLYPFTLLVERQDEYVFEWHSENRLDLVLEGVSRPIAVRRGDGYVDDESGERQRVFIDGFETLSSEDHRWIRGVHLDYDDDTPSKLPALPPLPYEQVVFTVDARGARTPDLPPEVQFLKVGDWRAEQPPLAPLLKPLRSLRWLELEQLDIEFPITAVDGVHLEHLNIWLSSAEDAKLDHTEIGRFSNLRSLELWFSRKLTDVEFVTQLPNLRRLRISRTPVSDLKPLSGHPTLRWLDVSLTRVESLPENLPELQHLNVVGAPLSEGSLERFVERHPKCRVMSDMTRVLQEEIERCDWLRLRTCRSELIETEGELFEDLVDVSVFETGDLEEIAELAALIEIEERFSYCFCGGDPRVELFRDGKPLVEFSVHHGEALRWDSGPWPMDAELAPKSGMALSRWLADRGADQSFKELLDSTLGDEIRGRREALYQELLPADVLEQIQECEWHHEMSQALISSVPTKPERIALVLRLIGCDDVIWNQQFGLDAILFPILEGRGPKFWGPRRELAESDRVTEEEIAATAILKAHDALVRRGAARWYFSNKENREISKDLRDQFLTIVGVEAMSHPVAWNRNAALYHLGQIDSPNSTELLRRVLNGEIESRSSAGLRGETNIDALLSSSDADMPEHCFDEIYAAYLLAQRQDPEARAFIENRLRTSLPDEEEALLRKALNFYPSDSQ